MSFLLSKCQSINFRSLYYRGLDEEAKLLNFSSAKTLLRGGKFEIFQVEKATFRCGCLPPCQVDFYHKVTSALFWHPDVQRESLGVERLCNSTVYVYMQSNKITVRRKVNWPPECNTQHVN